MGQSKPSPSARLPPPDRYHRGLKKTLAIKLDDGDVRVFRRSTTQAVRNIESLLTAVIIIAFNLLADILYGVFEDPASLPAMRRRASADLEHAVLP